MCQKGGKSGRILRAQEFLRNNNPETIMTFSELIRSEEELLRRLLLVSQRQLEIVDLGNATVLLEHLGLRERLWQEFELLEQQLVPHRGILPEQRIWNSADERQRTEAALNRCKSLLEEIMANDQISIEKTATRRDEVADQLRRIQRSGAVGTAYQKQSRKV